VYLLMTLKPRHTPPGLPFILRERGFFSML
jgi:hypothetical protein